MRRFLITSPAYTGEAEIIYDETGRLIRMDVMKTNMNAELVNRFKAKVAAQVDALADSFKDTKAVIIESDFEVSLDDFKREYPYSRNYHLLPKRWEKMSKTDQVEAYFAAIEYRKYCKRNDWVNPKIADGWLANKEYKNDWRKM
ncbi:MAG: hypothetical protein ABL876_17125 [Chitinophagaceae bacterium]